LPLVILQSVIISRGTDTKQARNRVEARKKFLDHCLKQCLQIAPVKRDRVATA